MAAFTAKNYQFDEAPAKITLLGDKAKRSESAQHIIEFPGGAIELSRLDDGSYWAHIIVNRDYALRGLMPGLRGSLGRVVCSRIARHVPGGIVEDLPTDETISQIAVLIRPEMLDAVEESTR